MSPRREHTKAVRGPNGFSCPCCRTGTAKLSRTVHNRALRRRARAALRTSARSPDNPA
jgi:hypothetical protein